jgi:hypothetical protein
MNDDHDWQFGIISNNSHSSGSSNKNTRMIVSEDFS